MAVVVKLEPFGNNMAVLFDDGSRKLAYPTNGGYWIVSGGGGTPPGGGARFIWPFDIVNQYNNDPDSDFGPRDPLPFHNGIDFGRGGVTNGSPVIAMGAGVVSISQVWNGSTSGLQALGNYVRIDHGGDLFTGYAHFNDSPLVTAGQTVTQGQILGYVGESGFSYGAHLHLETWESGTRIDPFIWMTSYANS